MSIFEGVLIDHEITRKSTKRLHQDNLNQAEIRTPYFQSIPLVYLLLQLYDATKLSVYHLNNGLGLSDNNVTSGMIDKSFLARDQIVCCKVRGFDSCVAEP